MGVDGVDGFGRGRSVGFSRLGERTARFPPVRMGRRCQGGRRPPPFRRRWARGGSKPPNLRRWADRSPRPGGFYTDSIGPGRVLHCDYPGTSRQDGPGMREIVSFHSVRRSIVAGGALGMPSCTGVGHGLMVCRSARRFSAWSHPSEGSPQGSSHSS